MWLESSLERIGEALRDRRSRRAFVRRLMRRIRRFFELGTILYFGVLVVTLLLMRWVGERNVTFAFLLYVPKLIFLLPLPLLIFPTILFHWRLAFVQVLLAAVFSKFLFGWQMTGRELETERAANHLTVLTYNRGQHMNQSLQPFKNLARPDLLVFQEAPHRARRYEKAAGYEEFIHALSDREFTLLSRFPILSAAPVVSGSQSSAVLPASRFVIDFNGRKVAVYAVHVISPRDTLSYYRWGAFLYGILGIPGTSWGEKRVANQRFWDQRIEITRELIETVVSDPLPALVAGDFNAPAGGYIHGLMTRDLRDAHASVGKGSGFTFPGVTRNPLSGGGPWIRIDYLLSDRSWRPVACLTEKKRPSQHRAVAATFEWVSD